jgi:hypothetical protein
MACGPLMHSMVQNNYSLMHVEKLNFPRIPFRSYGQGSEIIGYRQSSDLHEDGRFDAPFGRLQ